MAKMAVLGQYGLFRVLSGEPSERDKACGVYEVYGPHPYVDGKPQGDKFVARIPMLSRPAIEGADGATEECLLAIVADRLAAFARSGLPSTFTNEALTNVLLAQDALARRTKDREARKVEGTLEP